MGKQVVLNQTIFSQLSYSAKHLLNSIFHPDLTENLLTGALNLNTNKHLLQ